MANLARPPGKVQREFIKEPKCQDTTEQPTLKLGALARDTEDGPSPIPSSELMKNQQLYIRDTTNAKISSTNRPVQRAQEGHSLNQDTNRVGPMSNILSTNSRNWSTYPPRNPNSWLALPNSMHQPTPFLGEHQQTRPREIRSSASIPITINHGFRNGDKTCANSTREDG